MSEMMKARLKENMIIIVIMATIALVAIYFSA